MEAQAPRAVRSRGSSSATASSPRTTGQNAEKTDAARRIERCILDDERDVLVLNTERKGRDEGRQNPEIRRKGEPFNKSWSK